MVVVVVGGGGCNASLSPLATVAVVEESARRNRTADEEVRN